MVHVEPLHFKILWDGANRFQPNHVRYKFVLLTKQAASSFSESATLLFCIIFFQRKRLQ